MMRRTPSPWRVRRAWLRLGAALLGAALLVGGGALGMSQSAPAQALQPAFVLYTEPTTATVIDFFRPPSRFAGPGNRGWQYATDDILVSAAADGWVSFAGPIGDDQYITLSHADGLHTTYSFLDEVWVVEGQEVPAGIGIAEAGAVGLHFGVYVGSHYLDPEVLFTASQATPQLVLVPPP